MASDCIFCKIVSKEIESDFLYEDDDCIIIRDINPKSKTHLLILPKKHISSILELEKNDSDLVGRLIFNAKKISKKLNLKGYNLLINVGKDGGQEVFHLHIHLMSKF
jgi:histidine triad (HIT) family protein